jgi:hypothetical protein
MRSAAEHAVAYSVKEASIFNWGQHHSTAGSFGVNAAAKLAFVFFMAMVAAAWSADHPCGMAPSDWCPSPPDDPCGRHHTVASCRADPSCYGMPYRGESVIACFPDPRGFSSNCPTVGCTSTPPAQR